MVGSSLLHVSMKSELICSYVREHTALPVPQVLASSPHDSRVVGPYMVMTVLEGESRNKRAWADISPDHQSYLLKQLAGYSAQLCLQTFDKIGALSRFLDAAGHPVYSVTARPLSLATSLICINGLKLDDIMPIDKASNDL